MCNEPNLMENLLWKNKRGSPNFSQNQNDAK